VKTDGNQRTTKQKSVREYIAHSKRANDTKKNDSQSSSQPCQRDFGQQMCDVSFIIISWNAKKYLHECLISLQEACLHLSHEIIVVDNASTDGSWQMVQNDFPEVLLIRNANNTGFAMANNQGIEVSCGRYLCLVNSDVEVYPESIEFLLEQMGGQPEIGIIGPKVLNSDLSLQRSCRSFPNLKHALFRSLKLDTTFPRSRFFGSYQMTYWSCDDIRNVDVLSGCFLMIRREALRRVGLLDTRFFIYGEDIDLCKRFHDSGWQVVFNPGAQIIHHGGASSASAPTRFWIEMQRARLKYWLKHHGRIDTFVYYNILILHNSLRGIGFWLKCRWSSDENEAMKIQVEKSIKSLCWLLSFSTMWAVVSGKFR